MVAKRAGPIPEAGPKERFCRYQQFKLCDKVWGSLKEVISLIKRLSQQMIGLNRITLQKTHLLEVPDTPMGHLR
jgi:hypothetical protein